MSSVRVVTYKCTKCGSLDSPRYHEGFPPPLPALSCWKCHNGQGLQYGEMIQEQKGMFPIEERYEKE